MKKPGGGGRLGKYGETKSPARLKRAGPGRNYAGLMARTPDPRAQAGKGSKGGRITARPAGAEDVAYIRAASRRAFSPYGTYEDIVALWFGSPATRTLSIASRSE